MIQIIGLLLFGASLIFTSSQPVLGQTNQASSSSHLDHPPAAHQHQCARGVPAPDDEPSLESVQVETTDLRLYERFFEQFLGARLLFSMDHPLVDRIKTYCYHHLLITIRQDLKTPRITGWVQVNFVVRDLETLKQEMEEAGRRLASSEPGVSGEPYPIRVKRGIPRNLCRVDRLELVGPEGFLIGFNQIHKETCRPPTLNEGPRQ